MQLTYSKGSGQEKLPLQKSLKIGIFPKILPSWVATRKIYAHDFLIINNRRINLHQGNVET